jgi:hypothetical protein
MREAVPNPVNTGGTAICSVATPSREKDATERTAEVGALYVDSSIDLFVGDIQADAERVFFVSACLALTQPTRASRRGVMIRCGVAIRPNSVKPSARATC